MKQKTKIYFYLLLNLPGIAIHELSHVVFCWLSGVKVVRVVFFQFKDPAGYVEHHQPRGVFQSFFISFGPFLFGSLMSFALYWFSIYILQNSYLILDTKYLILAAVACYAAISISLNLFPSNEDANILLHNVNYHILHRFNVFALILYPFVWLIRLFNVLKRIHFDWAYALFLLTLAWWVEIYLL